MCWILKTDEYEHRQVLLQGGCSVRGIDKQPRFHQILMIRLLLEGTNYRVRGVSWNNLGVVKHVEFFSGITAGVEHDSLLPSWVVRQEGSDIENLSVDNDPGVVLLRVFGNLIEGEDLGTSL